MNKPITTNNQRRKIYLSALNKIHENPDHGICVVLIETILNKPTYSELEWKIIEHLPELKLLHPVENGDRFKWNLEKRVKTEDELLSLRQTILAFCIALTND